MLSVSVKLDRGSFCLDVSFEAESLVTGVFGPSGAGKSTLINLIAGLERPTDANELGRPAWIHPQPGVCPVRCGAVSRELIQPAG